MPITEIKKAVAEKLLINEDQLLYPPRGDWGDFSLPIFDLVQEKKTAPALIAAELKDRIFSDEYLKEKLVKIELVGTYLNFFIQPEYLVRQVLDNVRRLGKQYGQNNRGRKKVVVFEFSNVNTHKNFHIGHLRNLCFGESITNIYRANGYRAYPVSYINDFGIHVAKTLWSYQCDSKQDLNQCYAQTVKKMSEDKVVGTEVSTIMAEIEKRRGKNYRLWKKTRRMSLDFLADIYKKNNIKFKKTYYESRVIKRGVAIVKKLLEQKILVSSQGAIIADLEKYNLGVLPLIRSDGTALYPVADLALAEFKARDFKNLEDSYVVVDIRQGLYLKQLAKILSLAAYRQKLSHLPYEFVTLPEGMISSRSGQAVPFLDLYDEVTACLEKETEKRHADWSRGKILKNCRRLATAVLKFEMLKVSPQKIITFNLAEAVKFDGFSALYILYGLVRIKSLLRKAAWRKGSKFDPVWLSGGEERDLILHLAKYPETIIRAEKKQDQSEVAKYLFELFKLFNDYYQKVRILSGDSGAQASRLAFINSISSVAENALAILGIKALNEI